MKRIYLDQMKWIDFARADKGVKASARFADALAAARRGVESGLVSFPLSSVHYIETAKRRDEQSRRELATVMAELSRYHTIASVRALVPPEIDRALLRHFGRPQNPRTAEAFGVGIAHALSIKPEPFRVPEELPIEPKLARRLETEIASLFEWYALAGFPAAYGFDDNRLREWQVEVAEDLASRKEVLRVAHSRDGWHVGERGCRAAVGSAFVGWAGEIGEGLARAELAWDDVFALGYEGMRTLVEAMPIIHAESELQRQREAAADKPWSSHDVADLLFLMAAVVYCDVVVTERQWVDLIRRSRLHERYGTTVLSDLVDLPECVV